MYTPVLLMTLPTPCCMSDLMMNVHTCFTDDTTYTMVYVTLLIIIKPYDLFIFSVSSDLNFFTKFSGFYFFIDAQSDIQFLSSSSLKNIVWFSTKVLLSLSDISFILNIFGKKWIPIKFNIRFTKYVFI
jgi:hypothetical protein